MSSSSTKSNAVVTISSAAESYPPSLVEVAVVGWSAAICRSWVFQQPMADDATHHNCAGLGLPSALMSSQDAIQK